MSEKTVISTDVIETLRELQDDDEPDLVTELFQMYFDDAPVRITEMREAANDGVARDLERAAHTLKSASANLGCYPISELCAKLEKMAREGSTNGAPEMVAQVQHEFDAAVDEASRLYIKAL